MVDSGMSERKRQSQPVTRPGAARTVPTTGVAGASFGAQGIPGVGAARPASIEDVAQRASVSTATVSRVLNKPELVAPETARRVQQAVSDLGYRPNMLAKGLTTQQTRVIGLALPDISGEFYSELLRGADNEARGLGYHLLVSSEARLHGAASGAEAFVFGLVDGLALMITEPNDALLAAAGRLNVPIAVMDARIDGQAFDSVVVDNEVGTREAMAHLLDGTPPERLRFVGGPRTNFDTLARADAFKAALAKAGKPARPEQLVFGSYSTQWGEQWAKEQIAAGTLNNLGILCASDEIAFGVLQAAQDAGLSVPGNLRLVGFDDSRLSRLVRPRLSTVQVPASGVGAAAVRAIVRRVTDTHLAPGRDRLPTRFIARDSS